MSRFFSEKHNQLVPYVPGEQPKNREYVKLNTNESPFPPSPKAVAKAAEFAKSLELYSDPECTELVKAFAELYQVKPTELLFTNGSDEILNFAFMAFGDEEHPAIFPDITYGFYPVFAKLNHVPYEELPLKADFSIDKKDYIGKNKLIFLANPNAPTGMVMSLQDIEEIIASNKDAVVVVDEAYVDFGADSCVMLIHKYDNLLVTQTFSKSRSMAGARLGVGIACEALINDLNTIKYSTNPYNVNRMTYAAGIGAIEDEAYTQANLKTIIENRAYTVEKLESLGFTVLPSRTNFVFAKSDRVSGEELYLKLKDRGVLVRHFTLERIKEYNRITIGTKAQMDRLLSEIEEILKEA